MKLGICFLLLVSVFSSFPAIASTLDRTSIKEEAISDLASIKNLDLETAKRIALLENPSMAAANARVAQASERIRQAAAAYMPSVDAGGGMTHYRLSDTAQTSQLQTARFFNPLANVDNTGEAYQAGITASWTLFDGFARKFRLEAERFGEMEQREARLEARRLLLLSVATTFHSAQLAQENMAIAKADEAFNQRQVTDAEIRLQVGAGALSDVLNFKVQMNSARSRFNQSEKEYQRLLVGLAALMGVKEAGFPEELTLSPLKSETEVEMVMPKAEVLIADALVHRPDLIQTDLRIKQAGSQIEVARADFLPKLNLTADLTGKRDNNIGFEVNDFGYSMGLNVTYNLYSGGIREAKVREAVWSRAEAEQQYANLTLTVSSDVRQGLADLNRSQTEIMLQRSNTSLVEQNRDLVEKEYAAGQGTLVRLNEAQRDLITAQSRLALALVSLRQAWQSIEGATGRILTPFNTLE